MGDYTAIKDIEETLKNLLKVGLDETFGEDKVNITFEIPKEIKEDDKNEVSVFLYQIFENMYLQNGESQRIDNNLLQQPPMYLDLLYLITSYGKDKKLILGRVMQIFFDNAIMDSTIMQGSLSGADEDLKLLFNPLSLDDLTKIWSAFQVIGYRPSVSYMITPLKIDSSRPREVVQRVVSKEMNYYYMIPEEKGK